MTATRPHTAHVAGRIPKSGPVLAVLTDGPTDMAVAAHAADLAARTGTLQPADLHHTDPHTTEPRTTHRGHSGAHASLTP